MAATASAIIGGIGLAASIGSGVKEHKDQKDAVRDAEDKANKDLIAAQEIDRKLREEQALANKQLDDGGTQFGLEGDDDVGSFNDFLAAPELKTKSLGNISPSGLGFA